MTPLKYIQAGVLAALTLAAVGCTEEIDLKLDSTYRRLVVDGIVTTDTMAHRVKLTYSGDYFDNRPMPAVSGANVTITANGQTTVLTESATMPGIYLTPTDYHGIEGQMYQLEISGVDVDGNSEPETYTAQSFLNPVVPVDSAGIGYHDIFKLWQVLLYAKDPVDTENYYMFNIFLNDSLVSDNFQKVSLGDDAFFDGNYANGLWVYAISEADSVPVKKGDVLTLEMNSVDKAYYKYISAVQVETSPKIPMFSGAPANVPGNISNGALGFFAAYSTSRSKVVINKDKDEY